MPSGAGTTVASIWPSIQKLIEITGEKVMAQAADQALNAEKRGQAAFLEKQPVPFFRHRQEHKGLALRSPFSL